MQIKIIESMKRRDELAKQKADLMSRTEKLKMEIEVLLQLKLNKMYLFVNRK